MGLSSSQARLLTLTSRQHTIEGNAHRLQANKLRLANDSDAVYAKYIAALDDTFLKTKQISCDTAHEGWIDGSINNLMRYKTNEQTSGNVFYVRDIATGKLYIPTDVGNNYDSNSSDYMAFVRAMDPSIHYEHVNHNQYILDDYNSAVDNGYNTCIASTLEESNRILAEYNDAKYKDGLIISGATSALNALSCKNSSGVYMPGTHQQNIVNEFKDAIGNVISLTIDNYTPSEQKLIKASLLMLTAIGNFPPADYANFTDSSFSDYAETLKYDVKRMTATAAGGTEYLRVDYEFDQIEAYAAAMNGGTIKWEGTQLQDRVYKGSLRLWNSDIHATTTYTKEENIYNMPLWVDGASTTINNLLSSTGCSNLGDALKKAFQRVLNDTKNVENLLNSCGITEDDINHFKQYKNALALMETYQPDYEWIPSDKTGAKYWEEVFNAIQSSGGWIDADNTIAANAAWVGNMIKNASVILTAWDYETETLTTTSSALNTSIKEVTDQAYIEKVSQEYEDELREINLKDTRIDKRLTVLETEREAIMTEMDSIKEIIKDNVEEHFKFFS